MVIVFYRSEDQIFKSTLDKIKAVPLNDIIWIDLRSPGPEELNFVEELVGIRMQTPEDLQEIESSSRFIEFDTHFIANSNFLIHREGEYAVEPVSLIMRKDLLISYRKGDIKVFIEVYRRIRSNNKLFPTGYHILVALFEVHVDMDADLLELMARDISIIGKQVISEKGRSEASLLAITKLQETTMFLRENIIDKQRVVSAMLRSLSFPADMVVKLRIVIKDIASLLDHAAFSFERLEYLQNTFLGLINIDQNKIIKIFTVVSVVFMPPTLIASIYGMNFRYMPEISWPFGYVFAILLMIISSICTLYFFKRRKWL